MKKLAFIFLLSLIAILGFADSANRKAPDYDALYRELKSRPTSELIVRGRDLLGRNSNDSALAIFTIISNRYETLQREEDRRYAVEARNSIGIINFINTNYAAAYSNYQKAADIETPPATASRINLSAIYRYYGDKRRAAELLRDVLYQSIESGRHKHASVAMVNLMTSDLDGVFPIDTIRLIIVRYLENVKSSKEDTAYPLASHLSRAKLHILDSNFKKATEELKNAIPNSSSMLLPERSRFLVYEQLGRVYTDMQMKDSAMAYFGRAEKIAKDFKYPELLVSVYGNMSEAALSFRDSLAASEYGFKKYEIAEQSLKTGELNRIHELEMLHETNQFAERLNKLAMEEKMKSRILIVVAAALFLLSISFIYILVQNRSLRRKNKFLFETNLKDMRVDNHESQSYNESVPATSIKNQSSEVSKEKEKYASSSLSDEIGAVLEQRIRNVMADEKVFCREGFCLKELAEMCQSNSKYVSQVLNERMGTTFSQMLIGCRISEARKRFLDFDKYGNMTIEAIVAELGFRSRTTFSNTFKKVTGLSPSEFQRMAREEKNSSGL